MNANLPLDPAPMFRPREANDSLIALRPEQKRFFDENGYLVIPGLYTPHEAAEMRARMVELLRDPEVARPRVGFSYEPAEDAGKYPADPDNPRRVWMVFDLPLASDFWFDNIRDPRVVDVVTDLLGPNVNFHNGKARIKPPGYASHQGWHQDWPYERHSVPDLCAAITYLDDVEPGAASTSVLPGSHLRGEWPHNAQTLVPDEDVGQPGVPVIGPAGTVAFIHVLVLHRAGPNTGSRTRSAIINEYKTAEALDRWGNRCAFAELPLRRGGRAV